VIRQLIIGREVKEQGSSAIVFDDLTVLAGCPQINRGQAIFARLDEGVIAETQSDAALRQQPAHQDDVHT
jgi:hypothetical protein